MKNNLLLIDPKRETARIVNFLRTTFSSLNKNAVIGLSGGVDSSVAFKLLTLALPHEKIKAYYLPYFSTTKLPPNIIKLFKCVNFTIKNVKIISIKKIADEIAMTVGLNEKNDKVRFGNIAARMRMILLFDAAKKNNALVCGTENRTEELLGYFTRYGDAASDIEPFCHLYKTQIYELARYLKIPEEIINAVPSAGLWSGQTDEGEFGFTYEEADQVLSLYFDKKIEVDKIVKLGFKNAQKILNFAEKNKFKKVVPHHL